LTTQPNERWPDLAGRLDGRRHILPVRVYFEDTDFSGLVYHTSYLRWCERGRSDFLRLSGIHHTALFDGGGGAESTFFAIRHMEIDFLKPARMDDVLEVITEPAETGPATLTLAQRIERGGVTLFTARVLAVLLNRAGKPQRMPPALRQMSGG
jgi:acyl-CoA thioester hydrolase